MALYPHSEGLTEAATQYCRIIETLRSFVPEGRVSHEQVVAQVIAYSETTGTSVSECFDNLLTELCAGIPLQGTFVWRKINQKR